MTEKTNLQCNAGDKFEALSRTFESILSLPNEIGAALCLYQNGKEIINAHGGRRSANGAAWDADTLTTIWSCGKPIVAGCLMLLAMDGKLDIDDPIGKYWPEFSSNKKQSATIRMILNHTLGVPTIRDSRISSHWHDWGLMTSLIAAASPEWSPGERVGYHPYTYGWIVGELISRITGSSIRSVLEKRIAAPLNAPIFIGAPLGLHSRIAPQIVAQSRTSTEFSRTSTSDPTSLQAEIDGNPINFVNTAKGYEANLSAANMVSNAEGLALFFDALIGGRLLNHKYMSLMTETSSSTERDATFLTPAVYGLGVMRSFGTHGTSGAFVIGEHAFGHVGAGGHFAMADLENGVSLAFTPSRMGTELHLDSRGQMLIDALYHCLGYQLNSSRTAYAR